MSDNLKDELQIEIDLLQRIGQGDRASFEQFYDRVSGMLFGVALQILKDRAAAEDSLQEVFIQIWQHAASYNPTRGKPITWAVTLTRNRAIDRLRAQQRRTRIEGEILLESPSSDPSKAAALTEEGRLALQALDKLRKEDREVIELTFFHSLTQTEISERLQQPLGTVKSRMRRSMLKLREMITHKTGGWNAA